MSISRMLLSRSTRRRWLGTVIPLFVGLSVLLVQSAPCLACSPARDGLNSRGILPFANATNVARNAEVVVIYRGLVSYPALKADGGELGPLGSDVKLLDAGDNSEVPVSITPLVWLEGGLTNPSTAFRLKPLMPLRANARYEVADQRGAVPCQAGDGCRAGTRAAFSSFETGSAMDIDRPVFDGLASLETRKSKCESSSCCGPYDATLATLRWARAADSSPFVLYALYDKSVLKGYISGESVTFNACSTGRTNPDHTSVEPGSFRIDAVDLSGNIARTTPEMSLTADACSVGLKADASAPGGAGVQDGAADGGGPGEAGNLGDGGEGCGCRMGGRDAGGGMGSLLALVAIGLVLRRPRNKSS